MGFSEGQSLPQVVFNGTNFEQWKANMRLVLMVQELWDITIMKPEDETDPKLQQQLKRKQYHAAGLLQLSLAPDQRSDVSKLDEPHAIWKLLCDQFEQKRTNRLAALLMDLINTTVEDDSNISVYLNRMTDLRNKLHEIEENLISDKIMFGLVMTRLPSAYSTFQTVYCVDDVLSSTGFARLKELILGEEAVLKHHGKIGSSTVSHALASKAQKSEAVCNVAGSQGESSKKKIKKFSGNCNYCKKAGHKEKDCWVRKKSLKQEKGKGTAALSARVLSSSSRSSDRKDYWILDSGAQKHITFSREAFDAWDRNTGQKDIILGDASIVPVKGVGTVSLGGGHLEGVYYAPQMDHNLLSAREICRKNKLKIELYDTKCLIKDPKQGFAIVATGTVKDDFWVFEKFLNPKKTHAFVASTDDTSKLWHERLGHLNFRSISLMDKLHMVEGLPHVTCTAGVCEGCMYGKHHRYPFARDKAWRAKDKLELVHTDIMGPLANPSFSKGRYILLFVDDFSRKTWVYILKAKSEVFPRFQEFKALVENQCSKKIKALRSDNGGEFDNHAINQFCSDHGIKREFTVPYTPQQNGVAERKNRTVMEMARCMVHARNLPSEYWAEAAGTAVYIINRVPTKAVRGMTPEEKWTGRKPSIENFKIFGCVAYAHVPDEKRKKLERKSRKCIFVGYCEDSAAFRLWDPVKRELVRSRDVQFDELSTEQFDKPLPSHIFYPPLLPFPADDPAPALVDQPEEDSVEVDNRPQPPVEEPATSSRPLWAIKTIQESGVTVDPAEGRRTRSQTASWSLMANTMPSNDPDSYAEAHQNPNWRAAMEEEYASIMKNKTWDLVPLPPHKNLVGCKWVYKTKLRANGEVEKYKARLVAQGFKQKEGIDYEETFAPVAKMTTVRSVIALAAKFGWEIHQLDVKSAFLNGDLREEIYMKQPVGFVKEGQQNLVCRLQKSLYGLKQAPRAWFAKINAHLKQQGFRTSHLEPNLYFKREAGHLVVIVLYVDDLILTGSNPQLNQEVKSCLSLTFEMTDLGPLHYFLGIEVRQQVDCIMVSQLKYVQDLLDRFRMSDCKPVKTPCAKGTILVKDMSKQFVDGTLYRQLVGSLIYLTHTRPDIIYAVGLVSRYMQNPQEPHWVAAKRILRYLKGTPNLGVAYLRSGDTRLVGYTDADWAGDRDDSKSTTGYLFGFGNGFVSWQSKKQDTVSMSTTEAEYQSLSAGAREVVWLQGLLDTLGITSMGMPVVHVDNQSAIKLSKNPEFHARTKHINVQHHFIRELIEDGKLHVEFCPTDMQVADIFTKPLVEDRFLMLRQKLGLTEIILEGGSVRKDVSPG